MSTASLFRADHVGSFLRPADLLAARTSGAAQELLNDLENKHIQRVLNMQRDLGLNVFTDGEFRRSNFMSDFTDAVDGFDLGDAVPRAWDETDAKEAKKAKTVSSITGIVNAPSQTEATAHRPGASVSQRAFSWPNQDDDA